MSFVDLPYPKVRVTGASALGYLLAVVADETADIAVNIDEDAFVTDVSSLRGLVEYVTAEGFVNCGMPDGGVVPIRSHHPLVTNPFFTIMNTSSIRQRAREGEFKGFPVIGNDYLEGHPARMLRTPYALDSFEPYAEFYVWMARNFRTLYLSAEVHDDGISTVLNDHLENPFLIHTWYSRHYLRSPEHTARIDARIRESRLHNPAGSVLSRGEQVRHWLEPRAALAGRNLVRPVRFARRRLGEVLRRGRP